MKLIGYMDASARARGLSADLGSATVGWAEITRAIRARYGFRGYPMEGVPRPDGPRRFEAGVFCRGEGAFRFAGLELGASGVMVRATTTDEADLVLDDLGAFLAREFGLRKSRDAFPRAYSSRVFVEFETDFERRFAKFEEIGQAWSRAQPNLSSVALCRLEFGGSLCERDDAASAADSASLLIERRPSQFGSRDRFCCSAPLATTEHLRLLAEVEAIVRDEPQGRSAARRL